MKVFFYSRLRQRLFATLSARSRPTIAGKPLCALFYDGGYREGGRELSGPSSDPRKLIASNAVTVPRM